MAQAKWSKRKTLSRSTSHRPIETEDLKYAWAAYKAGGLGNVLPEGLGPAEFKERFGEMVVSRFDAAWTMFADTKQGYVPAGMAFGFYPHPDAVRFLILDTLVWFPWASPRNRVECAASFFDASELPMVGFSRPEDKKFCETMAKIGLFRRVGTSMNVFPGEPASIWETKGASNGQLV